MLRVVDVGLNASLLYSRLCDGFDEWRKHGEHLVSHRAMLSSSKRRNGVVSGFVSVDNDLFFHGC